MPKRQCEGKTRASLYTERCKRPAMRDSRFCYQCGKRRHVRELRIAAGVRGKGKSIKGLPVVYSKILSSNLRDAIDDMTSVSPAEQLGLYEELALIRHSAMQAVAMYDGACNMEDGTKKPALVQAASALMRSALSEVVNTAKTISTMESQAADKISLTQVGVIVDQLVQVAYDVFHDADPELVEQFAERVKTRVKLPHLETTGTAITPDQEVIEMDGTIPGPPKEV